MNKTIWKKFSLAVLTTILGLAIAMPSVASAQANPIYKEIKVYSVQPGESFWSANGDIPFSIQDLQDLFQWFPAPTPAPEPAPVTPAPAPAPTPQAPAEKQPSDTSQVPAANQSWEEQVTALVNQHRSEAGLQPLTHDAQLSDVARVKSAEMRDRNYFSHQSPTYGSPFDMMQQFGIQYRSAGENIAAGQTSPQAVVQAWMDSPGHRANILNASYTKIGVGFVEGGSYGYYWTQLFTG